MTYEEALEVVEADLYTTVNGVKFVKKVVPETKEYLDEFNYDLLSKKYKLFNEHAKDYAKDRKFKPEEYKLELINQIFKS
jgi:hypothetical protein